MSTQVQFSSVSIVRKYFRTSLSVGLAIGLFAVFLVAATPHGRTLIRMSKDFWEYNDFRKTLSSRAFREQKCLGWEEVGLAPCIIREVRLRGFLDRPLAATRILVHAAVVRAIAKGQLGRAEERSSSFADGIEFFLFDLAEEARREGRVVAYESHDPKADDVFDPRTLDEAEGRAMRSLNGRLWKVYSDRMARMREAGFGEKISDKTRARVLKAYAGMEKWKSQIHWEQP